MLYLLAILNLAVSAAAFFVLMRLLRKVNQMKIRIEDTTLNALLTLAEAAIAADAHDKADLEALRASVANEEDMPADVQARIDALTNPVPPVPTPAP